MVFPSGIVMEAGRAAAAGSLLERVTAAPPAGAGAVNVITAWDGFPPMTVAGFRVRDVTPGFAGLTVSTAVCVVPPAVAEIVTFAVAGTELVVTVKPAAALPLGTVTLTGTVATEGLLLERVTVIPPLGAGSLKVTVPWEGFPPVTVAGFRATEFTVMGGGVTVSTVVWVTPSADAEIVT